MSLLCAFVCLWALKSWKYPSFTTYRRPIDSKEWFFAIFKFILSIKYCLKDEKRHHVCLVRYIKASLEQNFKIFKINFFLPIDHCAMHVESERKMQTKLSGIASATFSAVRELTKSFQLSYTASQKHESTCSIRTYVLDEFLTADCSCTTKYFWLTLIEIGNSHLYAYFGTFCVQIDQLFEAK